MKTTFIATPVAAAILALLSACSSSPPPAEVYRPIRSVELRYGAALETNRYFASVASRHEVEQAFRVAGKVVDRRVDVGQKVAEGDVLAVLDDTDYRLAEDAARRQVDAADARWRQAESDWQRMQALKRDGSVSESDEEHARSMLDTARAAAKAEQRKLELARNQVAYTVLRASRDGVVTEVRVEVGQVVATGQPVVAVANEGEPEVVADVPEAHLESFKRSRYRAFLANAPQDAFEVELRELSAQAAAQTRTYRARLRPLHPRSMPLGASATLIAERAASDTPVAAVPATALTQSQGRPALWAARPVAGGKPIGAVELVPVVVHGYRNDEVLVSGPPDGTVVVTAGVQKMSPGLSVAMPIAAAAVPAKAVASRSEP